MNDVAVAPSVLTVQNTTSYRNLFCHSVIPGKRAFDRQNADRGYVYNMCIYFFILFTIFNITVLVFGVKCIYEFLRCKSNQIT